MLDKALSNSPNFPLIIYLKHLLILFEIILDFGQIQLSLAVSSLFIMDCAACWVGLNLTAENPAALSECLFEWSDSLEYQLQIAHLLASKSIMNSKLVYPILIPAPERSNPCRKQLSTAESITFTSSFFGSSLICCLYS